MARLIVIGVIVMTALTIYSLIDCVHTPESKVRSFPKWAWLVIIIFVPGIGAISWIIAGKAQGPGKGGRRGKRIIPPDDDPDFLKKL